METHLQERGLVGLGVGHQSRWVYAPTCPELGIPLTVNMGIPGQLFTHLSVKQNLIKLKLGRREPNINGVQEKECCKLGLTQSWQQGSACKG